MGRQSGPEERKEHYERSGSRSHEGTKNVPFVVFAPRGLDYLRSLKGCAKNAEPGLRSSARVRQVLSRNFHFGFQGHIQYRSSRRRFDPTSCISVPDDVPREGDSDI